MPMVRTEAFPTMKEVDMLLTLFSHDVCVLHISCIPKRIFGIHDFVNNNNRCKKPMNPLPLPQENKEVLIIYH